jgi:hypothetical protein
LERPRLRGRRCFLHASLPLTIRLRRRTVSRRPKRREEPQLDCGEFRSEALSFLFQQGIASGLPERGDPTAEGNTKTPFGKLECRKVQWASTLASHVLTGVSSWIDQFQDTLMHWALPQGNFVSLRDEYRRWGGERAVRTIEQRR